MNTLIQIIKPLKDKKVGDVISVNLSSPKDRYWARRLKDAEIDGCCKIIEATPEKYENQFNCR